MAWENLDEYRLKQIIRQISGKTANSDDVLVTPAYLKCKGKNKTEKWFWVPSKRSHKRLVCGIKLYIVDYDLDEYDRVLVYDGNYLFAIPYDELKEIGFN